MGKSTPIKATPLLASNIPVNPLIAMADRLPKMIKSKAESRTESKDSVVALIEEGIRSLLHCEYIGYLIACPILKRKKAPRMSPSVC